MADKFFCNLHATTRTFRNLSILSRLDEVRIHQRCLKPKNR